MSSDVFGEWLAYFQPTAMPLPVDPPALPPRASAATVPHIMEPPLPCLPMPSAGEYLMLERAPTSFRLDFAPHHVTARMAVSPETSLLRLVTGGLILYSHDESAAHDASDAVDDGHVVDSTAPGSLINWNDGTITKPHEFDSWMRQLPSFTDIGGMFKMLATLTHGREVAISR